MASKAEFDRVVTDDGVVVPLAELTELSVRPGQRVHIAMTAPRHRRRNMRGVLAGKVAPVSFEDLDEISRDDWGDWSRD